MDQISSQVRPASREASQSHTRLSCAMSWNTMWFTLGRDSLEIFPCDTAVHCGADDVGGARLLPLGRGALGGADPGRQEQRARELRPTATTARRAASEARGHALTRQ